MQKRARYQNRIELLQGTLDLIILQTLRMGPAHGYAISHTINAGSGDAFKVETGSLYPALHRLEKQGCIGSEWGTSDHNQRVKYYKLTPSGRKHLAVEQSRWAKFVGAMASLMAPGNSEA